MSILFVAEWNECGKKFCSWLKKANETPVVSVPLCPFVLTSGQLASKDSLASELSASNNQSHDVFFSLW